MVLPCANSAFSGVAAVVVRGDKLKVHRCGSEVLLEIFRSRVVQ
jgi:hypothetical protein